MHGKQHWQSQNSISDLDSPRPCDLSFRPCGADTLLRLGGLPQLSYFDLEHFSACGGQGDWHLQCQSVEGSHKLRALCPKTCAHMGGYPVINNSGSGQVGTIGVNKVFGLTGLQATSGLGDLSYRSTLAITGNVTVGQLGNFIVGVPVVIQTIVYKVGKFQVNLAADGEFQTEYPKTGRFAVTKTHTGEF